MAYEERNGKTYYYRKRREGGRVVSEYVGAGEVADLCAQFDRLEQMQRENERIKTAEFCAEYEQIDDEIDRFGEFAKALADGLFLINGYHKHKGEWRRKRKCQQK